MLNKVKYIKKYYFSEYTTISSMEYEASYLKFILATLFTSERGHLRNE